MPNLPTSLILVLLALAWLVVLVPMFARSREVVPQTDDGVAGFRVLQRAGARLHAPREDSRRGSRREDVEDNVEDTLDHSDEELVGELVDDDTDEDLDDIDDSDSDIDDRHDFTDRDDDLDDQRPGRDRRVAVAHVDAERPQLDHDAGPQDDAADEWEREHRTVAVSHSRPSSRPSREFDGDTYREPRAAPSGRPAPHRPGRGGFDPEHAAATAAYRFRRRRIVTLTLLVIAGALVAGAKLVSSSLWIGVVLTGVVLAGYLTYLNRTVRVERAIAERRMARLRRAGEIRPPAAHEAGPVSPYRRHEDEAPGTGPFEQAAQSQVPAASRRSGVVVDLDDDDPAFDELEYYEPVVYRRAAGQ